jgi:hypothetical protein
MPEDEAERILLASGARPLESFPGIMLGWRSECTKCGREIRPTLHNLARPTRLGACRYCAGRGVDHEAAVEQMVTAGIQPVADFPGSDNPWPGICLQCGSPVQPRYSGIKAGQGGCTKCAAPGFSDAKPGFVYLVESEAWNAYKIGIANTERRLDEHRREGWTVVAESGRPLVWDFDAGRDARDAERAVLMRWRAAGAKPVVPSVVMRQKGASETVTRFPERIVEVTDVLDRLPYRGATPTAVSH